MLAFPQHGAFFAVLDAPTLPRLVAHFGGTHQLGDCFRPRTAACQSRHASAATAPMPMIGPGDDARRLQPAREIPRDLADVKLSPRRKGAQEVGLAAIAFIER